MTEAVKEFWDKQAEEHGAASEATVPDRHYRHVEIAHVLETLGKLRPYAVIDIGCGNGLATTAYATSLPHSHFTGIDYSNKMIGAVVNRTNLQFLVADVSDNNLSSDLGIFDMAITTRCLINLSSWKEQKNAIKNIIELLPVGGHYLMIENIIDGLNVLNKLRQSVGLDVIPVRWHNVYFHHHDLLTFCQAELDLTLVGAKNIGSSYYFASRVIYAKLQQIAGEPVEYDNPVNEFAKLLPPLHANCSPNHSWLWRKNR